MSRAISFEHIHSRATEVGVDAEALFDALKPQEQDEAWRGLARRCDTRNEALNRAPGPVTAP